MTPLRPTAGLHPAAGTTFRNQADSPDETIDSRALIPNGCSAVIIAHAGQHYTLRVTKANKLILTK